MIQILEDFLSYNFNIKQNFTVFVFLAWSALCPSFNSPVYIAHTMQSMDGLCHLSNIKFSHGLFKDVIISKIQSQ